MSAKFPRGRGGGGGGAGPFLARSLKWMLSEGEYWSGYCESVELYQLTHLWQMEFPLLSIGPFIFILRVVGWYFSFLFKF